MQKSFSTCLLALLLVVPLARGEGWNVELLGTLYDYWAGVSDVVIIGSNACVTTGATGLRMVDLSDPAHPILLGTCPLTGTTYGLEVVGNYAFVAAYNGGLRIVDISAPGNPIEIGSLAVPGYAYDVAVTGNYAYLVGISGAGFRVVDISNPVYPQLVNSLTFSGDAICLNNNYAYVAGSGGMAIFNIANPLHPAQVGFYNSPGYPEDVAIYGSYAYLPEYSPSALRVVDVSNPALPVEAGSITLGGQPTSVSLTGSCALVATWVQGLYVLDLSNPVNPVIIAQCGYPGTCRVRTNGTHAYTGVANFGMQFIDFTNPATPVIEGELQSLGVVNDVAVSGSLAYVASGNQGFRIVDVSNPLAPLEIGRDSLVNPAKVVVSGNYAYFIGPTADLKVENIADPTHPSLLAFCTMPDVPMDLAVQGNYVYLAVDLAGMAIVDVTNPTNPLHVGSYANPATQYVAVSGNYAYLTAFCYRNNMHKVDVSNPSNPFQVGYLHDSNLWGLSVAGDYVYVGGGSLGLRIFSSGLGPVGVWNTPGSAMDVSVSGNFAYVVDGSGGLRVIDVSNPVEPQERGYFDTQGSVKAAIPAGNLAYVADTYSLRIYDCSDALNPIAINLEPLNPPIVIPANGGSFQFNAIAQRTQAPQVAFYAWARNRYPDGTYTDNLLGPILINPPVGVAVTRQRTQVIPADWPAGVHYYIGYAHATVAYPAADADSFSWIKSTTEDGGPEVTSWENFGESFASYEVVATGRDACPTSFGLGQNHPNPFNPTTAISFELRAASHVKLSVYDIGGRQVAVLVDGWRQAGINKATFDGSGLASGVYLYRLESGLLTAVRKMVLLK